VNLHDVLLEINNFFEKTKEVGEFQITSNKIIGVNEDNYKVGQYVHIHNSTLNDDVYKITAIGAGEITLNAVLLPETSDNIVIFGLAIPKPLLTLVDEIKANGKEGSVQSESVSRYSVSYGEGGSNWAKVYRKSLDKWRKLRW
jgi:hypothetical protein